MTTYRFCGQVTLQNTLEISKERIIWVYGDSWLFSRRGRVCYFDLDSDILTLVSLKTTSASTWKLTSFICVSVSAVALASLEGFS